MATSQEEHEEVEAWKTEYPERVEGVKARAKHTFTVQDIQKMDETD